MTDQERKPFFQHPQTVDVFVPGSSPQTGTVKSVPVIALQLVDQRRWCKAAQDWLEHGEIPRCGCPTGDLRPGGVCRRSPRDGQCLLLLPIDHPDWQSARQEHYDERLGAFVERGDPAPVPLSRQPLALTDLTPDSQRDLVELARLEATIAAELEELSDTGVPVAVDAHTVLLAELHGYTIDLESGAIHSG